MRHLITTIVLCVVAQVAAAQCVTPAKASAMTAQARPGPELIASAVAGTGEASPLRRTSVTTASAKSADPAADEHRRPTGSAMLLAALALMTGIALRRASASDK